MNYYAIVDCAQCIGFHERVEALHVRFRSLFDGHPERDLLKIAPLVVELRGEVWQESSLGHELQKLANRRPAVSIVAATLTLDAMASHLRRFHVAKVPDRKQMLLRWYDTRIMPVWAEVLNPRQKASFFEGIASWIMHDRFGREVSLPTESGWDGFPAIPPLELDQIQYTRLLEAAEPDVLIAHLRQIIRDELKQVPEIKLYPFVVEHLEAAKRHGLSAFDDQVHYLLLALYTAGEFVHHPIVASRLRQHASECNLPFSTWAIGLPEDVADVASPLWRL